MPVVQLSRWDAPPATPRHALPRPALALGKMVTLAQKFLETAVAKKKKFREFLQSVVEDEKTHGRQEVV